MTFLTNIPTKPSSISFVNGKKWTTMGVMKDFHGATSMPIVPANRLTSSAISGKRSSKGFIVVENDHFEFLRIIEKKTKKTGSKTGKKTVMREMH